MKMRINLKNGNHWPKLNKFSFHGSDKKNFIWHRDIASSQLKWSEKMRFLQKNHLHWNGLDWNVCSRHTSKKNPAILPVWNEWKCRHAKKKNHPKTRTHLLYFFFVFVLFFFFFCRRRATTTTTKQHHHQISNLYVFVCELNKNVTVH